MTTYFLRNEFNHTIVDIDVSENDLHCVVDIEQYTLFLDRISDKKNRKEWVSDVSEMQEIRGEYHETVAQKHSAKKFVEQRCKEFAKKWGLLYVVD